MEILNQITAFFAKVWEVFSIEHPILGIPFSQIYIGVFAVSFSITILRPILGIGTGAISDITRSAILARNQANARRKAKYEQYYEAYNVPYKAYKARRGRAKSNARKDRDKSYSEMLQVR